MDAAHTIRNSLRRVNQLRADVAASHTLQRQLLVIKQFQARRFAGTYQDMLHSATFGKPTGFFLEELYGVADFSERDAQFGRIAGALRTFFPSQVVDTAVALAQLHALTEEMDVEMAKCCGNTKGTENDIIDSADYIECWRVVASPTLRLGQLQSVLDIGLELDKLTHTKGLRLTLRMMRGPAKAAGLHSLQSFLEAGFDTFASMGNQGREARIFLNTIRERESVWIDTLFNASPEACIDALNECLAKAE